MKTVKIKFVGFYEGYNIEYNRIYQILKKHYQVEVADDPDYIICSVFGKPYEYCRYPQVRIMYSGENYIPDFNLVDYAMCPYPIQFLDRNYFYPMCMDSFDHCCDLQKKDRNYPDSFLLGKRYFANFIASHESEYGIRGDFFKRLCEYKRVESPGTYLNNMKSSANVNWMDESKTNFQRQCKFTLCFESTQHNGFVTEKITDAFYSDTIPVYFGSETVVDIFNPKAFINVSDYQDMESAIQKIIEIDQDDEKYMEMIRQPIFVDAQFPEKIMNGLEEFVVSIFEQPIETAYRRSRVYTPKRHEDFLNKACIPEELTRKRLIHMLAQKCINRLK